MAAVFASLVLLLSSSVASAAEVDGVEQTPPPWHGVVKFHASGWVQPQVVWNQPSSDEVGADGQSLNFDRFVVRRGRLELAALYKYGAAKFEIDANTAYGPAVQIKGVQGLVFLPQPDPDAPPYVQLQAGLFDIPFGWTTTEDADDRFFMERTLGSRALFPGDSDVGAELSGGLGPLRYAVAVQNGVPVADNPAVDSTVYTAKQTFVGRLGVEVEEESVTIAAGASYLNGTGFHAGTPATKPALLWSDTNQDGLVSLNELEGVNGQASTPSATFPQWATGVDVEFAFETVLGWTRLDAEAMLASNLDRGLYVADPVSAGRDLREVAWNVGIVQEIATYGILGFRADGYNPDADATDPRGGVFVPLDAGILTLSPIVGGAIPDVGRLLLQYDYVSDLLGRDVTGTPADVANDQWTLRMQVEF